LILLIHPPAARPCEPPAGIARLAGLLASAGREHRLLDLNLEGLLHLARAPLPPERAEDTWTRRALCNRERDIAWLRDPGLYRNRDRYARAVRDLGRVLARASAPASMVGLANYQQPGRSPVKAGDLLAAAEHPERNPFTPFFESRLREVFRERAPAAAGISVNYLSQALCAFAIAGILRREFPGTSVIMGGGLITSWRGHPGWQARFAGLVDRFVAGPGETAVAEMLGEGLAPEAAPRPAYGGLPLDDYLSPGRVLPYSTSGGCHWNRCTFCPERAEGNPYRPVPARQVLSDLQALIEAHGPVLVHLLDNALPPPVLDALARERLTAPWYGFARVGRRLTDPAFCRALKASGCVMLQLGIESGDPSVLEALDKGTTVDRAASALACLHAAGIATYVYLLFGTPAEDEAAARRTLDFTARLAGSIDFLNLAVFNMPVRGPEAPGLETRAFYEGDLSLYTGFEHPRGWNRKRVRLFLDREFKRHPAVARIVRRDPPVFTSSHAPFLVLGRG